MKARAQGQDAPRACMRASCGAVRRESSAVRPQWAKMWRRLKHRCRKYSRPAPSLPSRIERKPLFCVRPSLKRLIIDYPEIPEPYNNLAVIEAGLGNLEEAVAHLKQALRINPDFALARKNLGDVYLALAREAYEQAVVKLPNNHVLERRLNTLKSLETAR